MWLQILRFSPNFFRALSCRKQAWNGNEALCMSLESDQKFRRNKYQELWRNCKGTSSGVIKLTVSFIIGNIGSLKLLICWKNLKWWIIEAMIGKDLKGFLMIRMTYFFLPCSTFKRKMHALVGHRFADRTAAWSHFSALLAPSILLDSVISAFKFMQTFADRLLTFLKLRLVWKNISNPAQRYHSRIVYVCHFLLCYLLKNAMGIIGA